MTEPQEQIPQAAPDTEAPEPASPELRHRHAELAAEITEHNYRYHVLDSPLVDDATYDAQMRELRVQHQGNPIRIFYAFDPRRHAILLIGGDKTGDNRFYEEYVPIADRLYDEYLEELQREGLI